MKRAREAGKEQGAEFGNYAGYYGRRRDDGRAALLGRAALAGREVLSQCLVHETSLFVVSGTRQEEKRREEKRREEKRREEKRRKEKEKEKEKEKMKNTHSLVDEVLDVGCHEGRLALALWRLAAPRRLLGIDLDPVLVRKARARRDAWAHKRLPDKTTDETNSEKKNEKKEKNEKNDKNDKKDQMEEFRDATGLEFEARNVMDPPDLPPSSYDVVLCLSVTKWIHLHHGDDGIRRLFAQIHSTLRTGGLFFLESQDFPSYKKKKRLMTAAMTDMLKKIQFKPDAFVAYLTENLGFELLEELKPDAEAETGFDRPIWKLRK
jgi:7SK snRNA methylphosphate capping enzyme